MRHEHRPAMSRPDTVPTMAFDWGTIKWFVTPSTVEGAG